MRVHDVLTQDEWDAKQPKPEPKVMPDLWDSWFMMDQPFNGVRVDIKHELGQQED